MVVGKLDRRTEAPRARLDRAVHEALRSGGAQIALGRGEAGIGRFDGCRAPLRGVPAGLGEQSPDHPLLLGVAALSEVGEANPATAVHEVLGRPVLVAVGVPGRRVVVLGDGVAQSVLGDRGADVGRLALEGELRRVHADDHEARAAVAPIPGLEGRQRADAVDAGIGPEVDQHDLSAQLPQ